MEDLTGKTLGQYQIVGPLGEGGMASVYKAYQPGVDRYVAVKVLPRHFAKDPKFVRRFQREAKIIARLQHPHILPVFDYGETDGYTFLAMPFIEAGTLSDLLHEQPLPGPQIRKIIAQIGDALDYAHSQGVIHRDVKPSNMMLDERGNCLLMDFGIGKLLEGSIQLTNTGDMVGTPAYMSPEQGLGTEIDGRSDIYSLGVMLYEMITGRAPFKAETPMAVVIKHIYDPLPPPRSVDPNIPEALERVVLKALAKNRDDRFATASEMVVALEAAYAHAVDHPALQVETQSAPAVPSVNVARPAHPKPARSGRVFVGLGLAGILMLAILLGGAFLVGRQFFSSVAPLSPTAAPLTLIDSTHTPELIETLAVEPTALPVEQARSTAALENDLDQPAAQFNTAFPLPDVVVNYYSNDGGESINFQTNLSMEETITFYRLAFGEAGYVERDINTSITTDTFSLVFDGHASGLAIVLQGVDLGYGTTNVNLRFEDV